MAGFEVMQADLPTNANPGYFCKKSFVNNFPPVEALMFSVGKMVMFSMSET